MDPQTLLYVLDSFPGPTAGTEGQFWLLYRLMGCNGNNPRIVTLRPSEFLARHAPEHYRCAHIGSLASPLSWWKAFALARNAHQEGVRIAHLFLNDVSVLLPIFFSLFGIKVIISRRDLGFWYTSALTRVLRLNRFFVDKAVCNCEAVQEVVHTQERYPQSKLQVILNGCEKPQHLTPLNIRSRYGIPEDALILGMIANLRPLKGIEEAISALKVLRLVNINAWLVVAGADVQVEGRSERERLLQHAKSLGVSEHVAFIGPVARGWDVLAEFNVFLSCSRSEGLSNSIIEAMMSGVPVVASSVGGTPSIVQHEHSGLLYTPGNLTELVTALCLILKSPSFAWHLVEEAKLFAQRHLSTEALRDAHERLYCELLGINPIPHTQSPEALVSE